MDYIPLDAFCTGLMESPILLVVACLGIFKLLGALLNSLWCLMAALLLHDCDFLTKMLPEQKVYWMNRVAWVTGACSGIGLSVAKLLALRGCRVILSSNRPKELKSAVQQIIQYCSAKGIHPQETDFLVLPCDMLDLKSVEAAVPKAHGWQGKIDFLFNNAGVIGVGAFSPYETDERVIAMDLLAQIKITKLVVPLMQEAGFGHIIFTASMYGRFAAGGFAAYCTAKHGLRAFAEGLDRECRAKSKSIAITIVCPGWVDTPIFSRAVGPAELPEAADYRSKKVQVGLSSETVALKMLKATSNKLSECWVSRNPELLLAYFNYYVPYATRIFLDSSAKSMCAATDETIHEIFLSASKGMRPGVQKTSEELR